MKWAACDSGPLALFARTPEALANAQWPAHVSHRNLKDFNAGEFSLVINALGAGDPKGIASLGSEIFEITRAWDERVLATAGPDTGYIFLSSGAVYGSGMSQAVEKDSMLCLPVNGLDTVAPYLLAKLCAEARHRALPGRAILDIRVFGYADASIPRSGAFFLSELARAIATRMPFVTTRTDMVRDYAGVDELYGLIRAWMSSPRDNRSVDLYTNEAVSKSQLLEKASKRYGLEVLYQERAGSESSSIKPVYASQFHGAAELGYVPHRTSMDVVLHALDMIAAQ